MESARLPRTQQVDISLGVAGFSGCTGILHIVHSLHGQILLTAITHGGHGDRAAFSLPSGIIWAGFLAGVFRGHGEAPLGEVTIRVSQISGSYMAYPAPYSRLLT